MTLQASPLRAFPTQARIWKVLSLVEEFSSSRQQPLATWRSLLGVMSSMSALIPESQLRMRSLQLCLNVAGPQTSKDVLVSWDDSCLLDLWWWSVATYLEVRVSLDLPHSSFLLFTDASDSGWGASLGEDHLSGLWSPVASNFSINHCELLAILLAIRGFLHLLKNRSVAPFSDNTTAMSYLRKEGLEGSTHSSSLNVVAQAILRLCETHAVRLLPQFIPGRLNVLADSLSRSSQILGSEWTLCREVCQELFHRWPVTIDLFATSLNHRLQVYFSLIDQQSAGTDAMFQTWDNLQAYAFPPFVLIPRVLAKVCLSRNLEVTLVALFWPLKPWFPDLLELLVEVPILLPMRRDSTQTAPLSSLPSEPLRASVD